jgi:hypothetical protein
MWHLIFSSIQEDHVAVADFRAAAVSLVEEAHQVVAGHRGIGDEYFRAGPQEHFNRNPAR